MDMKSLPACKAENRAPFGMHAFSASWNRVFLFFSSFYRQVHFPPAPLPPDEGKLIHAFVSSSMYFLFHLRVEAFICDAVL